MEKPFNSVKEREIFAGEARKLAERYLADFAALARGHGFRYGSDFDLVDPRTGEIRKDEDVHVDPYEENLQAATVAIQNRKPSGRDYEGLLTGPDEIEKWARKLRKALAANRRAGEAAEYEKYLELKKKYEGR